MNTLVLIELEEGQVKKSSIEAVCFAKKIGRGSITGIAIGSASGLEEMGKYGAEKVLTVTDSRLDNPEAQAVTSILAQAMEKTGASLLVMPKTSLTDAVAPRVAAREHASVASNVMEVFEASGNSLTVKRAIYTGKAFSTTKLTGSKSVITVKKNSIDVTESGSGSASVEAFTPSLTDKDFIVKRTGIDKATGEVLLTDAEIVVSGGRGLKGPENWGMVEDLAHVLHAATGCSKPVSDMGWRPHHEHVGQTGIKVSPNLYIAIGISGAIQHVAGINSSKVILAINKDPEAPIFKAADYGIAGDLFDVVPKLTQALKN